MREILKDHPTSWCRHFLLLFVTIVLKNINSTKVGDWNRVSSSSMNSFDRCWYVQSRNSWTSLDVSGGTAAPDYREVRPWLDKNSLSLPLRLEDSPPQPPRKQQSPSNNGTGKGLKKKSGRDGWEEMSGDGGCVDVNKEVCVCVCVHLCCWGGRKCVMEYLTGTECVGSVLGYSRARNSV